MRLPPPPSECSPQTPQGPGRTPRGREAPQRCPGAEDQPREASEAPAREADKRDEPAAQPPAPVVGMVGAGQLARMTSQAATGLGIGFRVLAASPADSAALVCQGTQVGDYRSPDDLAAFAAGCDVVTFDHEQVPAAALAGLARSAAAIRPGP